MYSTKQICEMAGIDERKLHVWIGRGNFTTEHVRSGGTGNPREYTAQDARHLYFVAQIISLGLQPSMAEALWRQAAHSIRGSKTLAILPGAAPGAFNVQVWTDQLQVAALPPVALLIRVQALFDAADSAIAALDTE